MSYALFNQFKIVWNGFQKQGAFSVDSETGSCRYRGPNGVRCAAGHLIPDSVYSERMEGISWRTLVSSPTYPALRIFTLTDSDVMEMQNLHDKFANRYYDKKDISFDDFMMALWGYAIIKDFPIDHYDYFRNRNFVFSE